MALLSLREVSLRFGGEPLLDGASLNIERGDHACLVGRNGCGKSSLLQVLDGSLAADGGERLLQKGIRVARLPQESPAGLIGPVRRIVEADAPRPATASVLTRLGLDPEANFETLSGGMKRRTLLARALVREPDLLLLDEPTNHLDVDTIEWLEGYLRQRVETFLFVTHDRAFLRRLATHIIDLDRGQLAGWNCDYDTFVRRKQQLLDDEAVEWERLGKRLNREEAWLRQGIKARRTRNEGRVRALRDLRKAFRERREQEGVSRFELQSAERSGRLVIKTVDATFGYPDAPPLVRDLSLRILRGDRIGIIGPNGSGKTTLLKLLCGELPPTAGHIEHGTRLQCIVYDQLRDQLDEAKSIAENIAGERDTVMVNGRPRHVHGYLREFLFDAERARTPVRVLSGGERNRVMLAKCFAEPGNLLIMDEPTNDLDIETLELLEEQLQQFDGTLLLVSHDRTFLSNVVTRTLVLEGGGQVGQYAGGYEDWLAQRPKPDTVKQIPETPQRPSPTASRRLSYNERREHARLPEIIASLEAERDNLFARFAEPDAHRRPPAEIVRDRDRLDALDPEIDALTARWIDLASRIETAK